MEPFFSEAVRFFRFSSSSFFRGRRTGGKSGEILILSLCDFRFLAFCNHWLRCCRSLNRTITPALSFIWEPVASRKVKLGCIGNAEMILGQLYTGSTCYVLVFIGRSVQSLNCEAPFTAMDVKIESLQSQLGGNLLDMLCQCRQGRLLKVVHTAAGEFHGGLQPAALLVVVLPHGWIRGILAFKLGRVDGRIWVIIGYNDKIQGRDEAYFNSKGYSMWFA